MTETQEKFVQARRNFYEARLVYEQAKDACFEEVGEDGHFQAKNGAVFKAVRVKGKFIQFNDKDFVSTEVKPGGSNRSLSLLKAKELGYIV